MRKVIILIVFLFAVVMFLNITAQIVQAQEKIYSNLGNKVVCPISDEAFNITDNSEEAEYEGKIYYFCCPSCKEPFKKDPEKYLNKGEEPHHQ